MACYLCFSWIRLGPPSWSSLSAPFDVTQTKVDILDRDDDILVRAELPGVDKKDLDVTISGNSMTIKGITRHEKKKREEKGLVCCQNRWDFRTG